MPPAGPPTVKRGRGRPPKNPPSKPVPTTTSQYTLVNRHEEPKAQTNCESSVPGSGYLTLSYNTSNKCLCNPQLPLTGDKNEDHIDSLSFEPNPLCPHHGSDNKSKTLKEKISSAPESSQKKRKRASEDNDSDYEESNAQKHRGHNDKQAIPQNPHRNLRSRDAPVDIDAGDTSEYYHSDHDPDTLERILERRLLRLSKGIKKPCYSAVGCSRWSPYCEIHHRFAANFLALPPAFRKKVHKFLTPNCHTVYFPKLFDNQTFRQLNPEMQLPTQLMLTHSQVYNDCRSIIYGENTFVFEELADLFFPIGIQNLRSSTARRIKHIAMVKLGTFNQCDFTSEGVADSLHQMVVLSPAFLNLQSITIRFEVSRPVNLSLFRLQMYLSQHKADVDGRTKYVKTDIVKDAAARVAYKALQKGSPFQGLVVEDWHRTFWDRGKAGRALYAYQARLFRSKESLSEGKGKEVNLHEAILDMLSAERLDGVPGVQDRLESYVEEQTNPDWQAQL